MMELAALRAIIPDSAPAYPIAGADMAGRRTMVDQIVRQITPEQRRAIEAEVLEAATRMMAIGIEQ